MTAVEADVKEMRDILRRLEPAISKLAERVEKLDEKLQRCVVDLARLDGRVSQLPTTITLLGFILTGLVASGLMRHFFP